MAGVKGTNDESQGFGVVGTSSGGIGVLGSSTKFTGVSGSSWYTVQVFMAVAPTKVCMAIA